MNIFKLCSLIIFYFISRVALSAPCENLSGYKMNEKVCFDKAIKGWISEKCSSCDAEKFFKSKKVSTRLPSVDGRNPAALLCHQFKLEVVVLKDSQNNEQSYCIFPDKSLVDANAIERHMK
jgi:hypothetical protein